MIKRIVTILLCTVLIAANITPFQVFATDDEYSEETYVEDTNEEEQDIEEDGNADDTDNEADPEEQEPEQEIIRELSASKSNVSFGSIENSNNAEPIRFSVTNKGNTDVDVVWQQSDAECAFLLDILSDDHIGPGEEMSCQVSLADDLPPGDYSCTLSFQDAEEPSSQVTVDASVKITEPAAPEEPEKSEDSTKKTEETSQDENVTQKNSDETPPAKEFFVKAKVAPRRAGTVSGTGRYAKGAKAELIAYAHDGYEFEGWYRGDEKLKSSDFLTVRNIHRNHSFTAKFDRSYYTLKVRSSDEDCGTVSGGGRYKAGQYADLTAKPKRGYAFKGWFEGDKLLSKDREYSLKVKDDRKIRGVFKTKSHIVRIGVTPKKTGKVTGEGTYKDNSDVTITAEAEDGYVFCGFFLNNQLVTTKEKYTVKGIDRDLSFKAQFKKLGTTSYTMLSGVANKGGAIYPSGEMTIGQGDTAIYTICPKNGYEVQAVYVDGKNVGNTTSYVFKNIRENHKISVVFAPKKNNVKNVKKDKVISVEEAKKYSVMKLYPADGDAESKSSNIVTPEEYQQMKDQGKLDEILLTRKQNVVGVDGADDLPDETDQYNYDEALGLYQVLDLSPDEVREKLKKGEDEELIHAAYEAGTLNIQINNQYLVPGDEEKTNSVFEDDRTIQNMLAFVKETLTMEEKAEIADGTNYNINIGIIKNDDIDKEAKEKMEKAGAQIDEYFTINVSKQREEEDPVEVTELENPVQIKMQKASPEINCVLHYYDGKVEILNDIGRGPKTITIETAHFSPFAFARKSANAATAAGKPLIYILLALIAAAVLGGGVYVNKRKKG